MGYATVLHVRAMNAARRITGSSIPDATQVIGFIDETAGVIDAILTERGYVLPIPTTATSALKMLEHFNALGGWAFTERSAAVAPDADKAEALWAEAQKMLRSGTVEPAGVLRDTQTTMARAPAVASPFFQRDTEY